MSAQQENPAAAAQQNHDPDRYENRVWDELTEIEQEAAILVAEDSIYSPALTGATV